MPSHPYPAYSQMHESVTVICDTINPILESRLNEIGYSSYSPRIPDDGAYIAASEFVGHIDNHDVHYVVNGDYEFFFFVDDTGTFMSASIGITNQNELRRIEAKVKKGGLITALIMFVCRTMKRSLIIPSDERLSQDGLRWLMSIVKHGGRGLKISDQNGNYPNPDDIFPEWDAARIDDVFGPTSITFESVQPAVAILSTPTIRVTHSSSGMLPVRPKQVYIGDFTIL